MQAGNTAFQAERQEVQWLLESGILGRSTNVARMFQILCEKYFENPEGQIKEYTIAVEGLGRSEDFDSHIDPVVRVTAHLLRKRLREFYSGEGAERALHVSLPLGRYTPQFILRRPEALPETTPTAQEADAEPVGEVVPDTAAETPHSSTEAASPRALLFARYGWWLLGALCLLSMLAVAGHWFRLSFSNVPKPLPDPPASTAQIPAGKPFRMLVGSGRPILNDRSGNTWQIDNYCRGGESYTVPNHPIAATVSPEIFLGGRRGQFHCSFPAPAGLYEMRLYFADTNGTQDAVHSVIYSINDASIASMDVVDTAPGSFVATEKIFPGLEPEPDGKIHLDFRSGESFLNAIELIPANNRKLAPIRIAAGDRDYTDANGTLWLADRFFSGGRRTIWDIQRQNGGNVAFSSGRVGHFTYSIPVEKGKKYTVRLHFLETWFGNEVNPGKRVFDVTANGTQLLRNFDIFAEGGRDPLVKSFQHVEANGLGKIELEFVPVSNFAVVCAMEVVEE